MSDNPRASRPLTRWILLCVLVVGVLSVCGWFRLHIDSSLEPLLPEKSEARRTVLFLRDSSFAARAVLWFRLRDGGTAEDLIAAADATEKKLDPKLIKPIVHPPGEADALDQAIALMDHAGELLNENDLAELKQVITPDGLKKRMREVYLQLLKPEGSFFQPIIRRDPLGIEARILQRLLALTNGFNYKVEIKNGHLLHPDGRQLLLVMETTTTVTSLAGSEALVKHLDELRAAAPPNVEITALSPQIHTEQNNRLMQADINRAGMINGIFFVLLFLVVCRDWRVTAIFLLPIITIAATIGLCALVYPHLSTIVIGLAITMAGSAVDYGIFVYTAVWLGSDPKADVRRIQRPLIICHVTTLGVFIALLFSHIPAYRQLGYLTSVSLILSLLGALFVLPTMIKPGGKIMALRQGIPLRTWGKMMVPATILGAAALLVAGIFARKITFDRDISKLDGITQEVRNNEADFQKAWGRTGDEMALLVASGKTLDDAERTNDRVYGVVANHLPEGQFVSLSSFWPSAVVRRANEKRWQAFWTPQRIATVRRDVAAAAAPYGFAADAFDPFFDSLSKSPSDDPSNPILAAIEQQFVATTGNGEHQMLSFFPDTEKNVTAVRAMVANDPDAQVVSRRALGQAFAESAMAENRLLIGVSAAFILVSLLVLTRSVLKSIIIMVPAICGVVFMLATLTSLGLAMSVVSIVVAILVMALAEDYGVFAVYAWDGGERMLGQGMASMHLSSLTTLAGTASLIFAKHPALHLVGVSMTSGILAGYLTAFIVIPGTCYLLEQWRLWRKP